MSPSSSFAYTTKLPTSKQPGTKAPNYFQDTSSRSESTELVKTLSKLHLHTSATSNPVTQNPDPEDAPDKPVKETIPYSDDDPRIPFTMEEVQYDVGDVKKEGDFKKIDHQVLYRWKLGSPRW